MAGMLHIKRMCHVGQHHFVFAHVRAYAIRPYTCSIDFGDWLGCVLVPYSPTSGRMPVRHTPVRLLSWPNTINHYPCSIEFWADNIMTKPPKRLRRCWLGLHKTAETIVTTLTRVTQNPQNDRDDADSGHTKPPKRSWRRWLGSHKTVVTVATMLTRVTQNPRNGCDDGIVFTFFSKFNRNG